MTGNSEIRNVPVTLKISDNFLKSSEHCQDLSEDVPANFQSFQSYLKVTILACFDLVMVQSHYSVPSFTAGILFFPGL